MKTQLVVTSETYPSSQYEISVDYRPFYLTIFHFIIYLPVSLFYVPVRE